MGHPQQAPIEGNVRPDGEPYRVRKHKPPFKLTEVQKINLGGDTNKGKGMCTPGHRAKMSRRYDEKAKSKPARNKSKTPSRELAEQFAEASEKAAAAAGRMASRTRSKR